ncbi:MAG: hypothetical protein JXR83_04850, partial [Deltaproteobacteria bacterium]|nr:hypothetical protein [Deltaproteobacteria bacterium]
VVHHGFDAARRRRRDGQLMVESDLYPPVRDWLAANGYTVRGEVRHCDVAAVRGDDLVAIELKRGLSLALLAQAARRQRHADSVYVAVPRPAHRARWRTRSRDTLHLLRRLELGLLFVDARAVDVVLHPVAFERHRRSSERRAVLTEVAARSVDLNRGGSRGVPLVTAYREAAIRLVCALAELGPSSPRQLRALGTGPRTLAILSGNVYGWFERVARGVYRASPGGVAALRDYPALAARLRAQFAGRGQRC